MSHASVRVAACRGLIVCCLLNGALAAEELSPRELLDQSRRIVFLGDSITYAGQYVANFDAWREMQRPQQAAGVIDVGLPSETVSGLSEEGHAGGQFPRPDLAERLDRVLAATRPDQVIACYGMNCGIYQPIDTERFERYQQGMQKLKAAVGRANARFVVVTPPYYDDQRGPKPFRYDDVLGRYADWLLGQREQGWRVVDLHGPMIAEVKRRRQADPQFTFSPDAVHPNEAGQWFISQRLIAWFGDQQAAAAASPQQMLADRGAPAELLPLVTERMSLLRDAYLTAAGHKRPGIAAGLPVDQAEEQAQKISARIEALLAAKR